MDSLPDEGISRETSLETLSEAASSASGRSEEVGISSTRKALNSYGTKGAISGLVKKMTEDDPLSGATATCCMCDVVESQYLCPQCGRLSFCRKCCLSLHDNKFLSSHTFLSLDLATEGDVRSLADVKDEARQGELVVSKRPEGGRVAIASHVEVADEPRDTTLSWKAPMNEEDIVDHAGLAADRSVIHARLKELRVCLSTGKDLHRELSQERTSTKDATATAVEAVRRRFDVLRNLLNAKEEEFVSVVTEAGKQRFEAASSAVCSVSIATSELDGFITHLALQLDRLEENKVQFDRSRRQLLDTTSAKLNEVDGWTHDHQSQLQDVRGMSLGMKVPIERAADAIQDLTPPVALTHRSVERQRAELQMSPVAPPAAQRGIPASAFLTSPGVKAFKQEGGIHTRKVQPESQGRQLMSQELTELRNTPLHEVLARGRTVGETTASTISAPNASTVVADHSVVSAPSSRQGTPTRVSMRFGPSAPRPNSPTVRPNSGRGAPPISAIGQAEIKQGHVLRTTPVRSNNSPIRSAPLMRSSPSRSVDPLPSRPAARGSPLRQSPAIVARNATSTSIKRRPSPVRRG